MKFLSRYNIMQDSMDERTDCSCSSSAEAEEAQADCPLLFEGPPAVELLYEIADIETGELECRREHTNNANPTKSLFGKNTNKGMPHHGLVVPIGGLLWDE